MARQGTYVADATVHDGDKWLITDITDGGTKSLSVETLAEYFASTGIADPNRIGFHYTFTNNTIPLPGQFKYTTEVSGFGNVSGIVLNRRSDRGVDFTPVINLLDQTNLKLTDVNSAKSTDYAFYETDGEIISSGDLITIPLSFVSGIGAVSNTVGDNIVIGVLGHFAGVTGGEILEGAVDPITSERSGLKGDVFFHVDEVNGELNVYGPLNATVPDENMSYDGWGTPIQLNGSEGEAVSRVSSTGVFSGGIQTATRLQFYVGVGDDERPILATVDVPRGIQGEQGEGIVDANVSDSGELTFTGSPGYTGNVGPFDIQGPVGPLNGISSYRQITDEAPVSGPFSGVVGDYLEITFDNSDILYIPDAEDGAQGQGVNAIRVEPRGTNPTETYNVQVQYINNGIPGNFVNIGVISDGVDGTPGTNGTGTDVEVTTNTSDEYRVTFTTIDADGNRTDLPESPNLIGPTLQVDGGASTPALTDVDSISFEGTAISDVVVTGGAAVVTINDDDTDQIPDATETGQVLTSTGTGEGDWEWDAIPADTITVQDETVVVGGSNSITTLNFTGGVAVTAGASGVVNIDISGGTPVAMTPALTHSGEQQKETGETFSILLSAVHVDTFVITPPVDADLTNGWTQSNSTDSNGNVTVLITPDSATVADTSVLTVNGTYTLAGNPDVFNFPEITIPLATFYGWHYAQPARTTVVDLPSGAPSIDVDEFFGNHGAGTLEEAIPNNGDQGHFVSPRTVDGTVASGRMLTTWLYFAFPGTNEYKFYNEGRRLRNLETSTNTASGVTFRYYRIQVGDDFEITITT